jgi:DNA-binding NarL/FixJ family response regulator
MVAEAKVRGLELTGPNGVLKLFTKNVLETALATSCAGGAHRPTQQTADLGDLTTQQQQITELAAAALTNKEIGTRLIRSARTVGNHPYQIFPKLGVTSRAALRDALTDRTTER